MGGLRELGIDLEGEGLLCMIRMGNCKGWEAYPIRAVSEGGWESLRKGGARGIEGERVSE